MKNIVFLFVQILFTSFGLLSSCNAEQEFGDIDLGCRAGSYKFNDFCYSMNSMRGTYQDAVKFCEIQGGELMSVKNENDNLIVQRFIIRDSFPDYWIGLNGKNEEGVWMFGDETPVGNFTAWAPDKPHNECELHNCGYLWFMADYKWADDLCHVKKMYICQFSPPVIDCVRMKGSPNRNECFRILFQLVTYEEAEKRCRWLSGNLASLKTKEVYEFVKTLIDKGWKSLTSYDISYIFKSKKDLKLPGVWAGIKLINGSWTMNDGTNVESYKNWAAGEPKDISRDENCVVVREKWNEVNCKDQMTFLCKYNTFEYLHSKMKENSSVSRWNKSQLIGLFFGGLLCGILTPFVYCYFLRFVSKIKINFKKGTRREFEI